MVVINNDNINAIIINENLIKSINIDNVLTYRQSLDNLKFYILDGLKMSQIEDILLGSK